MTCFRLRISALSVLCTLSCTDLVLSCVNGWSIMRCFTAVTALPRVRGQCASSFTTAASLAQWLGSSLPSSPQCPISQYNLKMQKVIKETSSITSVDILMQRLIISRCIRMSTEVLVVTTSSITSVDILMQRLIISRCIRMSTEVLELVSFVTFCIFRLYLNSL